ncbi:MAG: DUF4388 domain-containing protein [Myxococcota bacterium]
MAERLFVDVSQQGTLVAPTAQARAALARRAGRWVLMPSATNILLLSQWEGPENAGVDGSERAMLLGEIAGISLLDLLGLFSQTRRSVRVVVSRGVVERAILLREGEIASVASSDPRDRLGEFLVRIGKLSAQQLQDALNTAQQTGRKLGQHLVASGALSSHELWSAIQQQITEIICDVVSWRGGSYAVFSLPDNFQFPQTPPLQTQALMLEAVRRADEMSLFRQRIPSYDTLIHPTGKMPRECSPDELAALQTVSAGMTVRDLGSRLQRSEFETTKIVYNLLSSGAVSATAMAPTQSGRPAAPVAAAPVAGQVPPSGTAAVFPPSASQPAGPNARLAEVVGVFCMALREIDAECRRRGQGEAYRRGMSGFLTDPQNAYHVLFNGVQLTMEGDVDPALVIANAATHGGSDPMRALFDGMNEMTFFALFQASELLDPKVDEDLARRVRMILSALQHS